MFGMCFRINFLSEKDVFTISVKIENSKVKNRNFVILIIVNLIGDLTAKVSNRTFI